MLPIDAESSLRRRGRPRSPRSGSPHTQRAQFERWTPAHVVLRVRTGLPSLRGSSMFRRLHRALAAGSCRDGFRLVHYSIQPSHIHLIVEAHSALSLTRGTQSLAIRLARAVNRKLRRRGKVFRERYRSRLVHTAREARNLIRYVLNNARRHTPMLRRTRTRWLDPCSSAPWFDGWSIPPGLPRPPSDGRMALLLSLGCAAVPPRTWLVCSGWRRAGTIDLTDVPGPPA